MSLAPGVSLEKREPHSTQSPERVKQGIRKNARRWDNSQHLSLVPGFVRNDNLIHGLTPVANNTGPSRAVIRQTTVCAPSGG